MVAAALVRLSGHVVAFPKTPGNAKKSAWVARYTAKGAVPCMSFRIPQKARKRADGVGGQDTHCVLRRWDGVAAIAPSSGAAGASVTTLATSCPWTVNQRVIGRHIRIDVLVGQ